MSRQSTAAIVATIGIDIGKNTFHLVGLDQRGNVVLQLKTSRQQLEPLCVPKTQIRTYW
jgi:transposase